MPLLKHVPLKLRWRLWGIVTKSRRICPVNAMYAVVELEKPLTEMGPDHMCRTDFAMNKVCFCGMLKAGTEDGNEENQ